MKEITCLGKIITVTLIGLQTLNHYNHIGPRDYDDRMSKEKIEAPTMRDRDEKCLSKKRFGYHLGHLSFWVSGMKSPLIFLYTKK